MEAKRHEKGPTASRATPLGSNWSTARTSQNTMDLEETKSQLLSREEGQKKEERGGKFAQTDSPWTVPNMIWWWWRWKGETYPTVMTMATDLNPDLALLKKSGFCLHLSTSSISWFLKQSRLQWREIWKVVNRDWSCCSCCPGNQSFFYVSTGSFQQFTIPSWPMLNSPISSECQRDREKQATLWFQP